MFDEKTPLLSSVPDDKPLPPLPTSQRDINTHSTATQTGTSTDGNLQVIMPCVLRDCQQNMFGTSGTTAACSSLHALAGLHQLYLDGEEPGCAGDHWNGTKTFSALSKMYKGMTDGKQSQWLADVIADGFKTDHRYDEGELVGAYIGPPVAPICPCTISCASHQFDGRHTIPTDEYLDMILSRENPPLGGSQVTNSAFATVLSVLQSLACYRR